MSNDGVSIGSPAPAVNHNILMEILGASESVQARIAAFEKAKGESEAAFQKLKLGQNAQQALDDANAKYAEVVALQEKAKADADDALKTLSDAQASAKGILDDAHAQYSSVMAQIDKAKADNDTFIANSTADIEGKQKRLDEALASVEADKAAANAAEKAAKSAQDDAEKAQDAAKAAEADFKDKAAKLQQALGQITN